MPFRIRFRVGPVSWSPDPYRPGNRPERTSPATVGFALLMGVLLLACLIGMFSR